MCERLNKFKGTLMTDLFPFRVFLGVCEDIHDPIKAGRIRVRAIGYHTNDKTQLPTSDLPWTLPISPITSASTSGKGTTPIGMVTGTWCLCAWIDNDQQNSICFGTFSGVIPELSDTSAITFVPPPERNLVTNKNDNILKDSEGNPILDSDGNPVMIATPNVEGWTLGQTSAQYETGGRGAGTINDYMNSNDFGGASYGQPQLASYLPAIMPNGKSRQTSTRSPLVLYLAFSKYGGKFAGLKPATQAFDSIWKQVANDDPSGFAADQHTFIKTNYYDVFCSSLKRNNLDMSSFGVAVQDLIWSTSVQYGANAVSTFVTPLKGKSQLSDADVVNFVQTYKYNTVNQYFKSSGADIQNGVMARCKAEQASLLALIPK